LGRVLLGRVLLGHVLLRRVLLWRLLCVLRLRRSLLFAELRIEGRVDGDSDPDVTAEALGEDPLEVRTEAGLELSAGEVVRHRDDRRAFVQRDWTRVGQPGPLVRRQPGKHTSPRITQVRRSRSRRLRLHRLHRRLHLLRLRLLLRVLRVHLLGLHLVSRLWLRLVVLRLLGWRLLRLLRWRVLLRLRLRRL